MSDPISALLAATAEALQESVGALTKIEREAFTREAFTRVLREKLTPEQIAHFAQEVAEHRRDPYTLVQELANGGNLTS